MIKMSAEQKKNTLNQADKSGEAGGSWLAARLILFGFIVGGLLLTAAAFFVMNGLVKQMVRQSYDSATQGAVEHIVDDLAELEAAVQTISGLSTLYADVDRTAIIDKIRHSVDRVQYFDQLLWLYQPRPGQWEAVSIYAKVHPSSGQKIYALKVDEAFTSYMSEHDILNSSEPMVDSGFNFITQENRASLASAIESAPFALMANIDPGNLEAGLIIGVGSLASTIFADQDSRALSLSIREVDTGYSLYNNGVPDAQKVVGAHLGQAYEFMFANSKWEIRTVFVPNDQTRFLWSLPFLIVVLGFMIVALGSLYIRSNTHRSVQLSSVYKKLAQKNQELQEQVQKRAELNEALAQSERENRSIVDAVSDIIFEIDTEGNILFLSAAWQKVTGFDMEQSKGSNLFNMLHNQDQETHRKDFQLMVRGQKQSYRRFARLRTSDGTFRAVELAFSMMRQDEDKNLRVVGTITDVEERRRAERALSEAEKKYRAIVENAAGGIYQLTPEGLYLSANPAIARILGYDGPEDLLRNIKDANEDIYVDKAERQGFLRELEKREVINSYEVEIYCKDGRKIWVNENVRVVRDEHNNTLYYEGSIEDITLRKKSEIAMRDAKVYSDLANRAKSEFLANMSHELRTPLNAIIGFSEIIKDEAFGPIEKKEYREYASDIHESGRNLLRIITEILDISKIEAGERHLNESIVDLDHVAQSALSLMKNKVESNKMAITSNLSDMPQIVGEELAIKQVIMNLLSNAIKFTPRGGRVNISAELDKEGRLRLSVTDTGVGLDKAEIDKALSPFGQVDNDLSREGSGTGLGLTLVDALMKLHGGTLELFSQKGIGTTATVIFPKDRVTVKKVKHGESGSVEDA
jgi:PAS domain S-box-containing protein